MELFKKLTLGIVPMFLCRLLGLQGLWVPRGPWWEKVSQQEDGPFDDVNVDARGLSLRHVGLQMQ